MQLPLALSERRAAVRGSGGGRGAMSLLQRCLQRRQRPSAYCVFECAFAALTMGAMAVRLPASGCRAMLRCGFADALAGLLSAALAAPALSAQLSKPQRLPAGVAVATDFVAACVIGLHASFGCQGRRRGRHRQRHSLQSHCLRCAVRLLLEVPCKAIRHTL